MCVCVSVCLSLCVCKWLRSCRRESPIQRQPATVTSIESPIRQATAVTISNTSSTTRPSTRHPVTISRTSPSDDGNVAATNTSSTTRPSTRVTRYPVTISRTSSTTRHPVTSQSLATPADDDNAAVSDEEQDGRTESRDSVSKSRSWATSEPEQQQRASDDDRVTSRTGTIGTGKVN